MNIFSFIQDLFRPASDLVDNLHTSDEERLKLRNQLADIESKVNVKLLELEKTRIEALSRVDVAEANSKHTLRALWRPIVSMALVAIIIYAAFKPEIVLDQNIYDLANVFLGGYVGGRSLEKIASNIRK
jgi:hypothetical protein